jgi:hypothetical protein
LVKIYFACYRDRVANFGPSEVRATSGQHLGGHYFRY